MTEIQPSPPGYRGQDETPGPSSCSPGSFNYTSNTVDDSDRESQSHNHRVIGGYPRLSYYGEEHHTSHLVVGKQSNTSSNTCQRQYHSIPNGSTYRSSSDINCHGKINLPPNDNDNHIANNKNTFVHYNEDHKNNTPAYKNDSGYSESMGYESFSLPLNERDEGSPPPTPPVRDASSLKSVCYGPGHEKYPSWPSAPDRHPDEDTHEIRSGGQSSGSHRSKSWTDHTNYPKEKPAQYTRPLAKRPNPAFTQQLKTVMERCEKIPAETFECRRSRVNAVEEEPRLWPRVDREGKPLGDADYVVPSPPEREQQQPSQTITHAELEAYVRSYRQHSHPRLTQQLDLYGETGLTQAAFEEYPRLQHSQQASYAQSEGYHSYVSSVDSTTNTPFLDRLRRDSEAAAVAVDHQLSTKPSWDESSQEGRDSVVTTSSGGSASSSETLKWHGSMSDVSVSSGIPSRHTNNEKWDRSSMSSDLSSINGSLSPAASLRKQSKNNYDKWQNSMTDFTVSYLSPLKKNRHTINNETSANTATTTTTTTITTTTTTTTSSSSTNNNNSNNNDKWMLTSNNKWQASMNDRNCKDSSSSSGRRSLQSVISHCGSLSDVCDSNSSNERKWQESNIDEETITDRTKDSSRNWEDSLAGNNETYNCNKTTSEHPASRGLLQTNVSKVQSPQEWDPLHGSMSDVSQSNHQMQSSISSSSSSSSGKSTSSSNSSNSNKSNNSSKQLIAHSARVQTPQRHHSESVLYLDREKSQRKLYMGQKSQASMEASSRRKSGSPINPQKQAHFSVAERISELEKQQQQQQQLQQQQQNQQQQLQMRYTYLDPEKRHRVSDPTLKAIQKKALLSFYERHQSSWRSEPQLAQGNVPTTPPQPPPKPRPCSSRRASSASDYSSGLWRERSGRSTLNSSELTSRKHEHGNSCANLSMDLLGPVIVGSAISIDDWVPERPPKKPHLRSAYNDRVPSPDLPPPSPPTVTENEVVYCDDPLPPPPPELRKDSQLGDTKKETSLDRNNPEEKKRHRSSTTTASRLKHVRRSERNDRSTKSSPIDSSPSKSNNSSKQPKHQHNLQPQQQQQQRHQNFVRGASLKHAESDFLIKNGGVSADLATHRMIATGRSSLRYPSARKMLVNDKRCVSRPPARLPDFVCTGNQRPAPQVPVESRIIRQESMRVESTRIDVSGLLRLESSSSGQRPQPQVPKNTQQSSSGRRNSYASSPPPPPPPPPPDNPAEHHYHHDRYHRHNRVYSVVGGGVKTGYEANSKLLAEASPQKYHEPPKYVISGNHQRYGDSYQSTNYSAMPSTPPTPPPKYNDVIKEKQPTPENRGVVASPDSPPPPPLAPRQKKNFFTKTGSSLAPPPRPAGLVTPQTTFRGSHSKASYMCRQERGAPDSEGSYKRTMSPTARLDTWQQQQVQQPATSRKHNDSVVLRQSPHQPYQLQQPSHQYNQQLCHSHYSHPEHNQQQDKRAESTDMLRSHSVDALHQRIEERNWPHSKQAIGKFSYQATNKYETNEHRSRPESTGENLHSSLIDNNDERQKPHDDNLEDYKERLSPQSVQVLNERNRDLERERIKLAASCNKIPTNQGAHDFNRETIVEPSMADISTERDDNKSINNESITETNSRQLGDISMTTSQESPSKNHRIDGSETNEQQSQLTSSESNSNSPKARSSQTEEDDCSPRKEYGKSRDRPRGSRSTSTTTSLDLNRTHDSPRYSPIESQHSLSPQPQIEPIVVLQRSEILLRVNAPTTDASSQTDILYDDDNKTSSIDCQFVSEPRRKLQEELECEELSKDLATQLGPNDKLVTILVPAPEHKKPEDYVSGLFRVEATLPLRPRRESSVEALNSGASEDTETEDDGRKERMSSPPTSPTSDPSSPLSATSAYFTTSEGKARFLLARYSRDLTHKEEANEEESNSVNLTSLNAINPSSSNDGFHLRRKKEELVLRLEKKVIVLRAEEEAVRHDSQLNEALGTRVAARVSALARPAESSKYRLHVEEVGKITSLLLGLSGRLARAENALYGMPADHPERKILESKRDKLMDQLEEAKILKSNIDNRSVYVSTILAKYLNDDEYADYQHFINMKAKLIMDGREIQDKVKLGEEQLAALKEAIN